MPIENTPAPAPAAAPVASPKTSADYQAIAMQALSEAPEAAEAAEAPAPAPEAPAPAPEPVKEPEAPKGFDALVREKAALRRREEALRAQEEQFSPIKKALDAQDPLSYLQAAGFTYEQLVQQLVEGKKPTVTPKAKEVDNAVLKEVQELRNQLQAERAQAQRTKALNSVAELAKSDAAKYKFTTGFKAEGKAIQYLEQYVHETGGLPAEDFDTSLRMALDAVEADLRAEAKKWEPLLTAGQKSETVTPAPVAPKEAGIRPQGISGKTLTNGMGTTPAAPRPAPRTTEEYREAALAALLEHEKT